MWVECNHIGIKISSNNKGTAGNWSETNLLMKEKYIA